MSATGVWRRRAALLLAEPTVWFFLAGASLFVAHRLVTGDPRLIVLTPGVKAELARQFRDTNGHPPTPAEMDDEIRTWAREEALSREAVRERLDRNDRTIRTVLADKLRTRVAVGIPQREPTPAELAGWLATHRSLYETPRRYDYLSIAFPKDDPSSPAALAKVEHTLEAGADPRRLGRPIAGGDLTDADLRERLGPALAAGIEGLPVGRWQRLTGGDALLLVRLNALDGGLPSADELRPRLVADWHYAERKQEVDRAVQAIVDRYHIEERAR
jgi:hypothetical protein